MTRRFTLLAIAPLLLAFPACGVDSSGSSSGGDDPGGGSLRVDGGGGDRRMTGTWEVHIDPDRAIRLELDGSFDVAEDKTEADAGETDIMVETYGTITATNVSDGRNVDGINTGLEIFVPIEFCPDWEYLEPEGTHCSRDLVSFEIPDLDVDESEDISISGTERATEVPSDQGSAVVKSMLADEAVVVSADRVFWNQYLGELNEACEFGTEDNTNGSWVTYFSEDAAVTACSTEAPPK